MIINNNNYPLLGLVAYNGSFITITITNNDPYLRKN